MLFISLFFALILLALACRAARPAPLPTRWRTFLIVGGGSVALPILAFMFFGVVLWLFLLLILALAVWPLARRRVPSFITLAAIAFLTAYGIAGWDAWERQIEANRLKARYPLESMAARVPAPQPSAPEHSAPTDGQQDGATGFDPVLPSFRSFQLRRLHENTVEVFVNSPGFGVARMVPFATEYDLQDRSNRGAIPAQPGSPSVWPAGATFEVLPEAERVAHRRMHTDAVRDFVNPNGWGYVTTDRRAAGFLPHAFSRVPEAAPQWRVEAVELVGLLRHPEPVVYQSDRLPAMSELRGAPTRPLDRFESTALAAVRRGENGFAARSGNELRFLAGIRSAAGCVSCHGGQNEDLLGAFSYALRVRPR